MASKKSKKKPTKMYIQPLGKFVEDHPEYTDSQFRWWIHNEKRSGIIRSGALNKKINRWNVDVNKFQKWLMSKDDLA